MLSAVNPTSEILLAARDAASSLASSGSGSLLPVISSAAAIDFSTLITSTSGSVFKGVARLYISSNLCSAVKSSNLTGGGPREP